MSVAGALKSASKPIIVCPVNTFNVAPSTSIKYNPYIIDHTSIFILSILQ